MKQDRLSYFLGAISEILIVLSVLLTDQFIIQEFLIKILITMSPSWSNAGLGFLPLYLLFLVLDMLFFPLLTYVIALLLKLNVSFGKLLIGFLLMSVLLNVVKLLFDLLK